MSDGELADSRRSGRSQDRQQPLKSGRYLEDGDQVKLTGWCQGNGYGVGFGDCIGRVVPAMTEAV